MTDDCDFSSFNQNNEIDEIKTIVKLSIVQKNYRWISDSAKPSIYRPVLAWSHVPKYFHYRLSGLSIEELKKCAYLGVVVMWTLQYSVVFVSRLVVHLWLHSARLQQVQKKIPCRLWLIKKEESLICTHYGAEYWRGLSHQGRNMVGEFHFLFVN